MDSANFLNCWETLEGVVTTIIEKSTMKVQQNYIIRQSAAKTLSLLGMGKVQRLFRKEVQYKFMVLEVGSAQTGNAEGNDIVYSVQRCTAELKARLLGLRLTKNTLL